MSFRPADLRYSAKVRTPFAVLGIRERGGKIIAFDYLPLDTEEMKPVTPLASEAQRQLMAFIVDAKNGFDLPILTQGTDFEDRVWREIRTIPVGHVKTYGDIARKVMTMPRAVGGACARNPLPLIIPCHRVVAAGGKIGGFMGGISGDALTIKRWLLAHEGVL